MIKYDNDVIRILKQSEKEAYQSNDSVVSIDYFILATLKIDNNIKKILNKFNIDYQKYKNKISLKEKKASSNIIFYSLDFKKILDLSYDTANRYQSNTIKLEHIFLTLIDENIKLDILKNCNLNLESFYKDLLNSITNNLNELIFDIGIDLTQQAKNKKFGNIVGREKEINQIIEILARKNKNNPILIGEAGVGKTAIVEELANMISNNNVPSFLMNKKIISINLSTIISGTKYRGEFEEKLNKIIKECENRDDIILFIDEIHTIVGAGGAEGAIDASNILKPALARGTIKLIGATTINEYKKSIVCDKALDRRFQKVIINIPSNEETFTILKCIKEEYEKFHNVKINDSLLEKIIKLSDKYILDRNNPDKSIDILDESCANTSVIKDNKIIKDLNKKLLKYKENKEIAITNNDYNEALKYKEKEQKIQKEIYLNSNLKKEVKLQTIIEIIENKCNSKIYDIESNKIYDYLKNSLNKKIIGQEKEINKIIDRLKILSAKKDNLPISFLITGPTGTGKTLFASELSKLINKNLIKLNMNDYKTDISINKIIGSPQGYIGYDDNNTVFEELKLNPNSIILLDEIEKANDQVLNLFYKVLEEGIIKNCKNEIVNFKNTIIIITSNNKDYKSIGYLNNTYKNVNISNEFVNRINYIVNFKELKKDDLKLIIDKYISEFNHNYNLKISLSEKDIENIITKSLYKIYGAKNIKNILKNEIEEILLANTTL